MTHAELVAHGERWLKKRCGVVLAEHTGGREFPDVIGWKGAFSMLIECKVSRADFLADLRKPSRVRYELRPAFRCYYLTPKDLLFCRDEAVPYLFRELPDGWGLLEIDERERIRTRIPCGPADGNDDRNADQMRLELYRLYCEVRRYQVQGLRPQTYAEFQKSQVERTDAPKEPK